MLDSYISHLQLQQESEHISKESLRVFLKYLELKGYAHKTIHDYLGAVFHFSRWQRQKDKTLSNATNDNEIQFLTMHLTHCRCSHAFPRNKNILRAALHLWDNVIGYRIIALPLHESEQLVLEFDDYLVNVVGLSAATRLYRCRHAREFLQSVGLNHLAALTQNDIVHYLYHRSRLLNPTSSAAIASSINQFLQFISYHNQIPINGALQAPRPKVPYSGPTTCALTDDELNTFLNAFDRTYPVGKRDYAMARCLSDLGIRTSDVAALQLDDIDWQHNIVTLHQSKSRRQQKLPLPDSLVDALIDYLCHARPITKKRAVFVYHCAPKGEAIRPSTVRGVIRRAFARAHFPTTDSQVHRLRHTMATRLLRSGQTIKTIADILGHQCIDTTIRYTTIDRQALCRVALPWPGRIAS